jgi:hypothetical protein
VAILEEENREILIKSKPSSLLEYWSSIHVVFNQRIKADSKLTKTICTHRVEYCYH